MNNNIPATTAPASPALGVAAGSAYCPDCQWTGGISECEHDIEQESWESPPYTVAYCPDCAKANVMLLPNTDSQT